MAKVFMIGLLLLGCDLLFGQNNWTIPKLISTGSFNQTPFITIDKVGTIHAFWAKADTIPGNHGGIMHAYSVDEGDSWTVPVNISNNPTDRPLEPEAVVDCQNNLHLFYHNLYNSEVWYQKCLNSIWTIPEKLNFHSGAVLKPLIDSNNRIYLFWQVGQPPIDNRFYFKYQENQVWSPAQMVSDSLDCIDWVIDQSDNINISSGRIAEGINRKAFYYKYDRQINNFTCFTDISNNRRTSGAAITLSNDSAIHIPVSVFGTPIVTDYAYNNNPQLNSWTFEENVCPNVSGVYRQIVTDSDNKPYIFTINTSNYDTLYLFSKTVFGWYYEIVACGSDQWINGYKAMILDDTIYVVYALAGNGPHIYFRKKQLNVGISEKQPAVINAYEMSAYPNPFNATSSILLTLAMESNLRLEIFNVKGELVQTLFKGSLKSGRHNFNFDAAGLNSGVYYCRLTAGSKIKTTKLMFLK